MPEPMTLEQWADLDEEEPGELVDEQLVEEEDPTILHSFLVAWFIGTLGHWASRRRALLLGSGHKLAVSKTSGRKPDVCMYAPGERLPRHGVLSRKRPTLIVEIISNSARDVRRDRIDKADEYARLGVRHYWLLDPESHVLEMWELGADGRYVRARSASDGVVEAPGFEGLSLDLNALWSEVEWCFSDEDQDDESDSSERPAPEEDPSNP